MTDGNEAALVARYFMRSPKGTAGVLDVAEFLAVQDDKFVSSTIFFDNKELAEFMLG